MSDSVRVCASTRSLAHIALKLYRHLEAAVVPPGSLTIRFMRNDPSHTVPSEIRIPVDT